VRLLVEEAGRRGTVGTLRTDETLLGRVLRNVVGNALKFTERGEVRLTAHANGDPTAEGCLGEMVTFTVATPDRYRAYRRRAHLRGFLPGS
jgi:signal transduction histidine kinase